MITPTLPRSAVKYSEAQRLEIQAAVTAVARQWKRMSPEFDSSWAQIAPTVTAIVSTAQERIATQSIAYIPAVLAETGQDAAVATSYQINARALVGVTGAGIATSEALSAVTIRAKQAVQSSIFTDGDVSTLRAGLSTQEALTSAGLWLTSSVGTILSDTGRAAESLGMSIRPVEGYIRMLAPPSCSRCVILAGKWYKKNRGFQRHPRCDCRHIPANEDVAGDLRTNPGDYFDSLGPDAQLKFAGSKANLRALNDGADMNQIVNAYRKTSGMQFAQISPIKRDRFGNKFTTEGTTARGLGGQQQAGLRRNGPSQQRLMPESIYKLAKSDADALRLLKLYGWISDSEALTAGRAIFAEQRRLRKNARARSRRAERR